MATTTLGGALRSGFAGAAALTALHETMRRRLDHPPRMDVIGMRALAKSMRAVGRRPPGRRRLFRETLAGDLLSNTLWYSLIGVGPRKAVWRRGLLLGAVAGAGAVVLPPLLGLGRSPGAKVPETALLTFAVYVAGGMAAAAAARVASGPRTAESPGEGPPRRFAKRSADYWDDPHAYSAI